MIKLLIVSDTYAPRTDGIVVFLRNVIPNLSKDFDVRILAPQFTPKKRDNEILLETSRIKPMGYPFITLSWKNFKKIKDELTRAEIVFIQGPSLLSFLCALGGRILQRQAVFYVHVIPWEAYESITCIGLTKKVISYLIKKIAVFQYNRCAAILVPYRELREELQHEGVKTRIIVARLGVDIARFSPPADKRLSKQLIGIASDKFVIGYVGRISKEKNAEVLLKAFKKLKRQEDVHLLLVGDGPEDQVQPFREIPNCTITGFVPDVQKYLKAMDIFVMPSLTETTSLATLEAMATGLPVIATKVGFIKSYIVKGHNGTFFPRNSAGMLAMKIEKLRKDPELRQKLGRNARKTVAYGFSWERSINKIKRLLKEAYYRKE